MSAKLTSLTYRPLTADDSEFCVRVHHLAMREYVEPLWGWDEAAQDAWALDFLKHRDVTHEIVLINDRPIGYISYQQTGDCLLLHKLYLHPDYHSKGLGSQILRRMIRLADSVSTPVQLSVLTTNHRARSFYARHGFIMVDTTAEKVRMRRATI